MTASLAIAALLVVDWFAVGTVWNVRKGRAVMRWMQGGLPLLGARATVRADRARPSDGPARPGPELERLQAASRCTAGTP